MGTAVSRGTTRTHPWSLTDNAVPGAVYICPLPDPHLDVPYQGIVLVVTVQGLACMHGGAGGACLEKGWSTPRSVHTRTGLTSW